MSENFHRGQTDKVDCSLIKYTLSIPNYDSFDFLTPNLTTSLIQKFV